jgi:hypothetical protein
VKEWVYTFYYYETPYFFAWIWVRHHEIHMTFLLAVRYKFDSTRKELMLFIDDNAPRVARHVDLCTTKVRKRFQCLRTFLIACSRAIANNATINERIRAQTMHETHSPYNMGMSQHKRDPLNRAALTVQSQE